MGERVAIVGSRGYPNLEEVMAYVGTLPLGTVVISSGARGVDQAGEGTARAQGLTVVSYRPRQDDDGVWFIARETYVGQAWEHVPCDESFRTFGQAVYVRNGLIVDDSERVEVFWDGESAGTRNTIRLAESAGKLGEIHRAGVRA